MDIRVTLNFSSKLRDVRAIPKYAGKIETTLRCAVYKI